MPSSTATPSSRPPEIEEILTTLSRYNPEATPVLQDYVATQCSTESYDIMANLALLKLYVWKFCLTGYLIAMQIESCFYDDTLNYH